MRYTEQQLLDMLAEMLRHPENEVVEFKEARTNYHFNDVGGYFSALSNEANLRNMQAGWLVFGVTNSRMVVGSVYRDNEASLQSLKKEIRDHTNQKLTFIEIYVIHVNGLRVVMFEIPPAIPGIPTTWNDMAYARAGESLCPLPMNKQDLIRHQIGYDWSKELVDGAGMSDLDPQAIQMARDLFIQHETSRGKNPAILAALSDAELLNKAGILLGGKVTRTALLLLGDEYAKNYFDGFIPRITWTLYNADGTVKTYEHFDMPFLLAVDEVYKRIRNVKYRYIAGQQTLFPQEVDQYDPALIKELLHNCIAHQDYTLRGRINVEEYEDYLVFMNEGGFIPETIEAALQPGYKPPYYRNMFLSNAMTNLYMIDANAMGIPTVFEIQRQKFFPLPTYDLSVPNRVKVTVYGKILDPNYTRLLNHEQSLNIQTVFLLDKVQKRQEISLEDAQKLRQAGLIEGKYPHIFVSFSVAEVVGKKNEYIRNRGLGSSKVKMFILETLEKCGPQRLDELLAYVDDMLPQIYEPAQRRRKLSNMLQDMKKEGTVECVGSTKNARWYAVSNK